MMSLDGCLALLGGLVRLRFTQQPWQRAKKSIEYPYWSNQKYSMLLMYLHELISRHYSTLVDARTRSSF